MSGEFEEIESTYEDEPMTMDCDVEICDATFVHVDDMFVNEQYQDPEFIAWWQSTSEKVLFALYSNSETKKAAVTALMKLFDYQYIEPEHLTLMNANISELYELYKEMLLVHKTHINFVKNEWCNILDDCQHKCRTLIHERNCTLNSLNQYGKQIFDRVKCEAKRIIVREEFEKMKKKIYDDYDVKIRIVKLEYSTDIPIDRMDFVKLKDKIQRAVQEVSHDRVSLSKLNRAYEIEKNNMVYQAAQWIQRECAPRWVEGLS